MFRDYGEGRLIYINGRPIQNRAVANRAKAMAPTDTAAAAIVTAANNRS
jgi:hypothetical protein